MTTSPKTLASSLRRCFAHNLAAATVLLSALLWGMAQEATTAAEPYRPPAAGSPADLMEHNDCWTGSHDMPADMAGVIPPRVLVTEGDSAPRIAGTRMVDKALEQIFEGADHGITVHGFCR